MPVRLVGRVWRCGDVVVDSCEGEHKMLLNEQDIIFVGLKFAHSVEHR